MVSPGPLRDRPAPASISPRPSPRAARTSTITRPARRDPAVPAYLRASEPELALDGFSTLAPGLSPIAAAPSTVPPPARSAAPAAAPTPEPPSAEEAPGIETDGDEAPPDSSADSGAEGNESADGEGDTASEGEAEATPAGEASASGETNAAASPTLTTVLGRAGGPRAARGNTQELVVAVDRQLPLPLTGPVALYRQPLDISARVPAFTAPTYLRHTPAKPDPKLKPELKNYAARFADAATAALRLYGDVAGMVRQLGARARDQALGRADRRQQSLDMAMLRLDSDLVQARLQLHAAERRSTSELEAIIDSARLEIRRTAGRATGSLRARATRIDTDLRTEQGTGTRILSLPAIKGAEIDEAQLTAERGMDALVTDAEARLEPPRSGATGAAMMGAKKEALVQNIHFPVAEAKSGLPEAVRRMKDGVMRQLPPAQTSICSAFCPFNDWKTMLRGEAVDAVGSARARSITQLDESAINARAQLSEIFHNAEKALIEQHDQTRDRLIEAARQRETAEHDQAEDQANQQAAMMGAVAGAQSVAVTSIDATIAARRGAEEAEFARTVVAAADGLIANGVPAGRTQVTQVGSGIDRARASIERASDQGNRQFLDGANRSGAQLVASADAAAATARQTVDDIGQNMMKLADPIRETMQGFLMRVNSQFAAQKTSLVRSLSSTETRMTESFEGGSSASNDNNEGSGNGEAGEASACQQSCRTEESSSSTSTSTSTSSLSSGSAPETANAFINRLKRYGTEAQTEPTIASFITTAPTTVATDLAGRARRLRGLLGYTDSNPYSVLDQLRGVTRKQGAAVEESYGGAGVLRADLDHYLNVGNLFTSPTTRIEAIHAARAYLNGNTEAGVVHELNIAVNWSNDSERIDTVMQSLTPDQMRSLNANYGSELAVIRADLNELDTQVFDDMRRGDVGSAIARRLQVSIDEARETRGDRGADAAVDAIAARYNARGLTRLSGAAQFEGFEGATAREARLAQAWDNTLSGFAGIMGVSEDESANAASRGRALIDYATGQRDYAVYVPNEHAYGEGGGHYELRREGVSAAQARLIENMVRFGEGSAEARAARLAVELGRSGGANPDRVRIATDDPELNADAVSPEVHRRAVERQDRMYRLVDEYSPNPAANASYADRTPADIRAEVAGRLLAGFPEGDRRARYVEALVTGNPDDPTSVVARLDYAMEGAGTSNDVLRQTLGTLTREQFDAVRREYDAHHDPDLLERIGIRGQGDWWNSETSGDTANELEVLSLGIPRNDRERAEVAALRMRQQITQAGGLGQILAADEFNQLNADYRQLMGVMGAHDVGFSADGTSFEARGVTGRPITLGRFDRDGNFVPPTGFSAEDLAMAMTLGPISAENYKAATDRIADGIATALVVAAAIVTTALTGGAAASIWIPVLVTAAAGVASMGVKYAIKGGRYGSEEMMLDLASTIVQAATAGIGAAAGAALRGGSKAVGTLATSMRVSEQGLAAAAAGTTTATKALPGLTLGQELFVGALSSGFAGGANAAINPDSYRSDHYASDIVHGILRGSISGAAGAGVTRGLTGGITNLARSAGAASGAREALRRGASLDAAARMASLRSQAFGTSALTEIGGRALGSGVSGMITRGTELAYDRVALGRRVAWHQAINEMGAAFVQNLVQGFGEGAVDRMMRSYSATRRAEHDFTTQDDHLDFRARGLATMEAEARRMGLLPPGGDLDGGVPGSPNPVRPGDAETTPQPRPTVAVEEDGTVMPQALHTDDPEGGAMPTAPRPASEDAPSSASGPRVLDPANDNPGGTVHQRVALSEVDMVTMPRAQEGAVFVHPDTKNRMAANDNFGRLINADPSREVAIHYNPVTGEHVVIQGNAKSVATIRPGGELSGPGANGRLVSVGGVPDPSGHWIVLAHFHPNRPGQEGTALIRRLPSGFGGDFGVVHYESVGLGHGERSSRIYFSDNGHVAFTDFGVTPGHPEGRFWIDYPDPVTGDRVRRHFAEPAEYQTFLDGVRANPELAGAGGDGARPQGLRTADEPAAPRMLAPGSTERTMHPDDHTSVRSLVEEIQSLAEHRRIIGVLDERGASPELRNAARGWVSEGEASTRSLVHALGLVDEPNSMARLHMIMNDTTLDVPLRQAIADAVLEATRAHKIANGTLRPDEQLMMLFHGAPDERARSLRTVGIDISLSGDGKNLDFSAGFYLANNLTTAEFFAVNTNQSRGEVFPFILPQGDMGTVIDVRPGGPHRAEWEAFVTANIHLYGDVSLTPANIQAMINRQPLDFGTLDAGQRRGSAFEAFLIHMAKNRGEPALARPDTIIGDTAGRFTTGQPEGEQVVARTRATADELNRQMGTRRTPPEEVGGGAVIHHADESGMAPPSALLTADDPVASPTAPAQHPEHALAVDALVASITRNPDDAIEFIGTLTRLDGVDEALFGRLLLTTDAAERLTLMRGIAQGLRNGGNHTEAQITQTLREVGSLLGRVEDRFRVEIEHARNLKANAAAVEALPPAMRAIVMESPLALHLMLNPGMATMAGVSLFDHFSARIARRKVPLRSGVAFDRFVMNSVRRTRKDTILAGHAAALERFMATIGDFNAGLEVGVPLTRQAQGEVLDMEPAGPRVLPKEVIDGLMPVPHGAQLEPGTRVRVPPYGFGTLMSQDGSVFYVHLDYNSAHGEITTLPHDQASIFLAPGEQPGAGGAAVPLRSQSEQDTFQQRIDDVRAGHADLGVQPFDPLTGSGTVAIAHVANQEFVGTNSTLAAALTTLSVSERNTLLGIMRQFGIDPENPGQRHDFVDHAELASLVLARQTLGRGAMPDVVELFVDRSACPNCRANLHALASWLGVSEIRIYYRNQRTPPPPLIIKAR